MTERDKVIKGLELCGYQEGMPQCDSCPYDGKQCWKRLKTDALALLKAQEPMELKIWEGERIIPDSIHAGYSYPVSDVFYDCGNCGVNLCRGQPNQFIQFCKHCGMAVKWE